MSRGDGCLALLNEGKLALAGSQGRAFPLARQHLQVQSNKCEHMAHCARALARHGGPILLACLLCDVELQQALTQEVPPLPLTLVNASQAACLGERVARTKRRSWPAALARGSVSTSLSMPWVRS